MICCVWASTLTLRSKSTKFGNKHDLRPNSGLRSWSAPWVLWMYALYCRGCSFSSTTSSGAPISPSSDGNIKKAIDSLLGVVPPYTTRCSALRYLQLLHICTHLFTNIRRSSLITYTFYNFILIACFTCRQSPILTAKDPGNGFVLTHCPSFFRIWRPPTSSW